MYPSTRKTSAIKAKGYTQKYRIDYETFSPVVKFSSVETVLAVALAKDMYIYQMDVETAFLNGSPDEEIFMVQHMDLFHLVMKTLFVSRERQCNG